MLLASPFALPRIELPHNRAHVPASLDFLGAIRGHEVFPSIPFNNLEGQGAPQNSFVCMHLVDSIPIARSSHLDSR